MNLLIITQKVNLGDDILGFFHNWIKKFAEKFESVNVICLQLGEYSLPPNVKVFSLGKEAGMSKVKRLWRFYAYIFKLRKNYDIVFVHMNPIYVLLGGIFWKIWRKKLFLWYIHRTINWELKFAQNLADKILTASPESCRLKNRRKITAIGHGIDTELFKRGEKIQKIPHSILYLGRISPIKNVDILIEAVKLLDKGGVDFVLNIVGEPGEKDGEYFEKIKELSKDLEDTGKINFLGKVPNYKTPEIYNQNEIFVNLTPSGSFDKAILEAIACETITLASNRTFYEVLPEYLIFKEKNPEDLKDKILKVFNLEEKEDLRKKMREYVVKNHNLDDLIKKIIDEFKK